MVLKLHRNVQSKPLRPNSGEAVVFKKFSYEYAIEKEKRLTFLSPHNTL